MAIRVQAVRVGQYAEQTRNIGDVFDIASLADFSDSTLDALNGGEGKQFLGWMIQVPSNTPLVANAPSPLTTGYYNGTSPAPTLGNLPRTVY